MPITSIQLRNARHKAQLTQAELAEKLGVSARTVVNWETLGRGVPERSEIQVASVLDIEGVVQHSEGSYEVPGLEEEQKADMEPKSAEKVEYMLKKAAEAAARNTGSKAGSSDLAKIAVFGPLVLEVAEAAINLKANPETVLDLLESMVSITLETGAIAIPRDSGINPFSDTVIRGTEIADQLVKQLDSGDIPTYRIQFDEQRAALAERKKRRSNVTPLRQTASSEDDEIPENVEEEWAGLYAAHPKGDEPQDHTP